MWRNGISEFEKKKRDESEVVWITRKIIKNKRKSWLKFMNHLIYR